MSEAAIELEKVHLSLGSGAGRVHILRGTDMRVNPGEAVGLVGPSGSGKSTLLSVVAGLERPDSGAVRVAGQDITGLNEDRLALFRSRHIGIVFQSFHLIANMTALENVAVPLEFAGAGDAFPRAEAMLARVGLADRRGHYPVELSGGEQQRVALARALVSEPAILLADEPTGNLDRSTGRQIAELIFAARERHGATLFLITHDPTLASLCDETRAMRDGRLDTGDVAANAFAGAAS